MKLKPLRDGPWLGLNSIVGIVFLWWSSRLWIEPELKDDPGARGGAPIVFGMLVVEILGPLFVLNVGWLIWNTRKSAPDRNGADKIFVVVALAWLALFAFSASKL